VQGHIVLFGTMGYMLLPSLLQTLPSPLLLYDLTALMWFIKLLEIVLVCITITLTNVMFVCQIYLRQVDVNIFCLVMHLYLCQLSYVPIMQSK